MPENNFGKHIETMYDNSEANKKEIATVACLLDRTSGDMAIIRSTGQTLDETANLTALAMQNLYRKAYFENGSCYAKNLLRDICEKIIRIENNREDHKAEILRDIIFNQKTKEGDPFSAEDEIEMRKLGIEQEETNPSDKDEEKTAFPFMDKAHYDVLFKRSVEAKKKKGYSEDDAIRRAINHWVWAELSRPDYSKMSGVTPEMVRAHIDAWHSKLEKLEARQDALQPCPHCGNDKIMTRIDTWYEGGPVRYNTGCWKCGIFAHGHSQEEADELWNKRETN